MTRTLGGTRTAAGGSPVHQFLRGCLDTGTCTCPGAPTDKEDGVMVSACIQGDGLSCDDCV